jgi:F0F1-type ATP synthase beta subunit
MSQKFTLFKPDGTPVRCSVDVTLEQLIDIDDYKDSDLPEIAALDKAISKIQEAAKSVEAVEGDRIDNIAAKVGETVRKVLEDNNIDNPLNIPVGKLLKF